jgi:hypothetical protein
MPPRIRFDELITILLTFIKRSPAKVEVLDVIAREALAATAEAMRA